MRTYEGSFIAKRVFREDCKNSFHQAKNFKK